MRKSISLNEKLTKLNQFVRWWTCPSGATGIEDRYYAYKSFHDFLTASNRNNTWHKAINTACKAVDKAPKDWHIRPMYQAVEVPAGQPANIIPRVGDLYSSAVGGRIGMKYQLVLVALSSLTYDTRQQRQIIWRDPR